MPKDWLKLVRNSVAIHFMYVCIYYGMQERPASQMECIGLVRWCRHHHHTEWGIWFSRFWTWVWGDSHLWDDISATKSRVQNPYCSVPCLCTHITAKGESWGGCVWNSVNILTNSRCILHVMLVVCIVVLHTPSLGTVFHMYGVTDWNAHHNLHGDEYSRLECSWLFECVRRQSACELISQPLAI